MNRNERRRLSHKFNSIKGLKKKSTKGSFGRPPEYIMEDRKNKAINKIKIVENKQPINNNLKIKGQNE